VLSRASTLPAGVERDVADRGTEHLRHHEPDAVSELVRGDHAVAVGEHELVAAVAVEIRSRA